MQALEKSKTTRPAVSTQLAPTDGELLLDFVVNRRHEAFASLVRKHAAMVLGVCRQILCDPHEAEDAFQATFLILAMRAKSIQKSASVGAWLHKVAYRTAMRAAKRRQQRPVTPLEDVHAADDVWSSIARQERQAALNEELCRLPERYRVVLVLCYLEGMTRSEAAEEMESTEAAVKALLARARNMLRIRLTRRGILLSAVIGAAAATTQTAEAASLGSLIAITMKNVGTAVRNGSTECLTTNIGSLAREGVSAMKLSAAARWAIPALIILGAGSALMFSKSQAGPAEVDGGRTVAVADGVELFTIAQQNEQLPNDIGSAVALAQLAQGVDEDAPTFPSLSKNASLEEDSFLTGAVSDESDVPLVELKLEVDYLEAKIKALQLYAKAKSDEAEMHAKEVERAKDFQKRAYVTSDSEILKLQVKASLTRAEVANVEAEVIRLRRLLSAAQRHVAQHQRPEAEGEPRAP